MLKIIVIDFKNGTNLYKAPISTLFLHFGPGANCLVEKIIYQDSLPIDWWDQPDFSSTSTNPSVLLRNATIEKIKSMQLTSNKKITLIGNSYGAYLATSVAVVAPELIEKIIILGAQPKISLPYLNLAMFLINHYPDNHELKKTLELFKSKMNLESFWALLEKITIIPSFMSHYWHDKSSSNFKIWSQINSEGKLLNFDSFTAIINDHHSKETFDKLVTQAKLKIPATFVYGQFDPFLNEKENISLWKNIFPELKTKALPCGHFVHLETEPTNWFASQ